MAAPKQLIRQQDFSAGELIEHAKRGDNDPIVKAGCRTMRNWRILATRKVENRPGRRLKFSGDDRVERLVIDSDTYYYLCFARGTIRIRNSAGLVAAAQSGYPWDRDGTRTIVWERVNNDIIVCYRGMRPLIARFDGSSAWSFSQFSFYADENTSDGTTISRAPFYKFSRKGITITPDDATGAITVTANKGAFTADHVGTRIRYHDKQILITAFTSTTEVDGTVQEPLPPSVRLRANTLTASGGGWRALKPGDAISNDDDAEGIVISFEGDNDVNVVCTVGKFADNDQIVGPSGKVAGQVKTSGGVTDINPLASIYWDEELMSDARGWPQSCFTDQNRLGFCDFESLPSGIIWSRIAFYEDFLVGADPDDPIFELVPNGRRVYHVIGGSDEFVFTDRGVFNVPISTSNPLKPGSVQFQKITDRGASQIRPTAIPEGPIYINAGETKVCAIVGTGQSARPYISRDISEYHAHLISSPVCVAVSVDGPFSEPYAFVLNGDGSVAIGKFDGGREWVGWLPWSGDGDVEWISASGHEVLFVSKYTPDATDIRLTESVELDTYLDAMVGVNVIPSSLGTGTDADILTDPDVGTQFGDMTAAGGLAAAFDDTTSQLAAASASKTSTTSGYIGKTLPVALPVKKAFVWPSSDAGFTDQAQITVVLYGKNGAAPANATDGVVLGGSGLIADSGSLVTINSDDTVTEYLHRWVTFSIASSGAVYCAEARFYTPGIVRAAPGGGTGDLWFFAGGAVDVMDGTRYIGERNVDGDGALVPVEGEDLSAATVVAGLAWDARLEPFIPHASGGQSLEQTLKKRELKGAVAVQQSNGFAVVNTLKDDALWLRINAYLTGENQDGAPTLREDVYVWTGQGQEYDPRVAVLKDTPGPLRVLELSTEVSV